MAGEISRDRAQRGETRAHKDLFSATRMLTEALAEPLSPEDQMLQSMPEASPTKWHLAHTTWFFETFLLKEFLPDYRPFAEGYEVLFNSYYESVGPQFERGRRGQLSRPSSAEVARYRSSVDEALDRLLSIRDDPELLSLLTLGIHHEKQHQELLLTDIKHALFQSPLRPAYRTPPGERDAASSRTTGPSSPPASASRPPRGDPSPAALGVGSSGVFRGFPGGIYQIGHGGDGFSFDNECPRHRVLLSDFSLARDLLTCGQVIEFVAAGGYQDPLLWLSDGWDWVQSTGASLPLYMERSSSGELVEFTLFGTRPIDPRAPALHLNFFEADAMARFFGCRLPTEVEWEVAAEVVSAEAGPSAPSEVGFVPERLHAQAPSARASTLGEGGEDVAPGEGGIRDLFGVAWQWTSSAYLGYPGFAPEPGAVGEYNGKFMHNQMVLRGSSLFTPPAHARRTYRNFFPGTARWQCTGVRLAKGGAHD